MGFDAAARLDAAALRAVFKCDVLLRCAHAGAPKPAPKGEYLVSRLDDGVLRFASVAVGAAFAVSFDAAAQHVVEGRLTVAGPLSKLRD